MRILLLPPWFPPEITTSGHLYYELSQALAERGHEVTVVAPLPRWRLANKEAGSKYRGKWLMRETNNGVHIIRVASIPIPHSSAIAKGLDHISRGLVHLIGGFIAGKQNVILVYSPSLFSGLAAYYLTKVKHIPFVLNAQDIFPQYAIDLGILRNRYLIKMFRTIEKFVYKHACYITVHSEGNRCYLASQGVDPKKLVVITNWVDTDRIVPSEGGNAFRSEYNLGNKFVVSYAGTIGWAQDLDTVIKSATLLQSHEGVCFIFVGEGPDKPTLENKVKAMGLRNVLFLPLQPWNKYPLVLYASDVCLVNLKQQLSTPVVPSKLLNIMASGRPVVASLPPDGDAAAIIKAAHCGICVNPGDAEGLAHAILELHGNPVLCQELGRNGREHVEEYYSLSASTEAYERLFSQVGST